jgi:hypothetical protein
MRFWQTYAVGFAGGAMFVVILYALADRLAA